MSRWARWSIGVAALLGGSSLLLAADHPIPPLEAAIIIAVFGLIVVACFSEIGRPIAVRVIGAAVFFTYFCYLFISLDSPYYSRRLGIDFEVKPWVVVLKALAGLLLWGVPGLYVMITGKFPWWWRKRSDNIFGNCANPHPRAAMRGGPEHNGRETKPWRQTRI